MIDVMIDIETLGTERDSVILSIGAVRMDMESLVVDDISSFYIEIDPKNQSGSSYQNTIDWWMRVGGCPNQGTVAIDAGLKALANFIPVGAKIWCKGTDFDTQILSHAYKLYNLQVPWKYNDVRDCRTIFKTFPLPDFPPNPKLHNALEDAKHQAAQLLTILKRISYD